jgi:hypothetical protein
MGRNIAKATVLAALVAVAYARPALAYIDPNTGGQLFQLLAISFAALSGVALIFSRHIRIAFARAARAVRALFKREEGSSTVASESEIDSGSETEKDPQ